MTEPLYLAHEKAAQAVESAQEELVGIVDDARAAELERLISEGQATIAKTRQALLEGDEPRRWLLGDDVAELSVVVARPSEVLEQLRAAVLYCNPSEAEPLKVKGYAFCEVTGQREKLDVEVPAEAQS